MYEYYVGPEPSSQSFWGQCRKMPVRRQHRRGRLAWRNRQHDDDRHSQHLIRLTISQSSERTAKKATVLLRLRPGIIHNNNSIMSSSSAAAYDASGSSSAAAAATTTTTTTAAQHEMVLGPLGIDPATFGLLCAAALLGFVAYLVLPRGARVEYFGAYPKRFAWSSRTKAVRDRIRYGGGGGGG